MPASRPGQPASQEVEEDEEHKRRSRLGKNPWGRLRLSPQGGWTGVACLRQRQAQWAPTYTLGTLLEEPHET